MLKSQDWTKYASRQNRFKASLFVALFLLSALISEGTYGDRLAWRDVRREAAPAKLISRFGTMTHTRSILGAYVGPGSPSDETRFERLSKLKLSYGVDFFDDATWGGIEGNGTLISRWKGAPYTMVWGLPMLPKNSQDSLQSGARGKYNKYYRILAQRLVAAGMGDSLIRLGWEFNSNSYPWYAAGKSESFVLYWRQIVRTMWGVYGGHFKFVWNPQRGDQGVQDKEMGNYAAYYPGDEYVNFVALDVYDESYERYPGIDKEFAEILQGPWGLNWLTKFSAAHRKPIVIPEFGLGKGPSTQGSGPSSSSGEASGGDDPRFIADMASWFREAQVREIGFWDDSYSCVGRRFHPLTLSALQKDLSWAE